jgi:hypothetical protein
MSVDLIQEWKDKTQGNRPSNNNLYAIANFYGTGYPYSPDNSTSLVQYIAEALGYNYDDPELFGVPYMQFINLRLTNIKNIQNGSHLYTIVNNI